MFEREMRESSFLKRWAIVRTLRDQSVAEHSYFVAMYTNDICIALDVSPEVQLRAVQYAMWHDSKDELFTSDLPGPQKKALVSDREAFDRKLHQWSDAVFEGLDHRSGSPDDSADWGTVKRIVKLADYIDAVMEMATESQLGNRNANSVYRSLIEFMDSALLDLGVWMGLPANWMEELPGPDTPVLSGFANLLCDITNGVMSAKSSESRGPFIAEIVP